MDEPVTELAKELCRTIEAAIATDDMLALLCGYFAQASPGPAAEFCASLKRIRESEAVDKTAAFVALSRRLEQALSGDLDLAYLSLRKQGPAPATPEELRARLRLIQGGRE